MAIDEVLPPMPQFASSIAGKPEIPPWDKPDPTKEDLNWAELRTLDLSLLDGSPHQQAELVETTRLAIQKDGFLFVKNFGMTEEQLDRHFALAQYIFFHGGISEEEKEKFMWDLSKGTFKGYKPRIRWGEKEGQRDQIEHFNWYQSHFDELPDSVPSNMLPCMDEIQGFADHMTNQVNRRLLVLLSRILGMPDNFLWGKVSARGSAGDSLPGTSYHRHMVYHKWDPEEYDKSSLIMHGHTDFGTLTLLPSQPVSCLQMLNAENEWRWVGYEPGRLLVNLGDALDVISGGQFKATRHKDMRMEPMMDTPLLKERGLNKNSDVLGAFSRRLDEGLEIPTYQEWKTVRSQGAQAKPEKIVDIDGVKYKEQMFNGTKLLMVI
ncbi:Clavaminate synthase-like protein [Colletotrichum asianum]